MNGISETPDTVGGSSIARRMDDVCRSAGTALLTDSQLHALDAMRSKAEKLAGSGRRDEALRTLRLAVMMIASGPPAPE